MNATTRKQRDFKTLVGKVDGDFYFLDYIFEDGDFKGATGSVLRPVSREEYNERMSAESIKDSATELWQMAVAEGQTEDSLEDWISYNDFGEDYVFDMSYTEYWPQVRALGYSEEDYPVIECTGGGRCFSRNQEFDHVYNQTLIKEIGKVEK